jgi:hypothetical protein
MSAIQSMAQTHAEFAAHIPSLLQAEEILEGSTVVEPYRNGSRRQGREDRQMANLPTLYETMKKRGVRNEELASLGLKVTALDIRRARAEKQAEVIRRMTEEVSKKRDLSEHTMTSLPGASERFKWQTPLIPAHPLNTTTRMINIASRDKS